MLSRAEFEKTQLLEARRADRKRAEDEKRRRRRIAIQKGKLSSPRLDTLEKRLLRLWCWLQPEHGPDPTDSKKIRQFRRLKRKVKLAIQREERRVGRPHKDARTVLEMMRDSFDSEEETRLFLAERAAEEAAERQCWRDKKKTPEGRAERLEQAKFVWSCRLQERYLELVNPDCRRPKKADAPVKTMAANA